METSWTTLDDGERIAIVHDNRWLAIVGIPLGVLGLVVAIGPWLIEEARNSGAWPILAVGSLIGTGILVAGLSLCFKYDEVVADRGTGLLTRHTGLHPFRRSRTWPLTDFAEVVCVDETMAGFSGRQSSLHHRVRLLGPRASVLVASSLEPDPSRAEPRPNVGQHSSTCHSETPWASICRRGYGTRSPSDESAPSQSRTEIGLSQRGERPRGWWPAPGHAGKAGTVRLECPKCPPFAAMRPRKWGACAPSRHGRHLQGSGGYCTGYCT